MPCKSRSDLWSRHLGSDLKTNGRPKAAVSVATAGADYFVLPELEPEAGDAPLLAPPGALRVPPPEVPPALGDVEVDAVSFSPRTSMSTRRSGCRQEMSLEPFTPLHWSPVTGSLSPRPSERTLVVSMPFCARYSFTAAARFSESCWLYLSGPMRSAWPIVLISCTFAPFRRPAISSIFCWPAGRSSALSNANSTSDERLICSMTGGCGGGAATSGVGAGGGAATATGGGDATCTVRTASHGAAAFSGVQSVVFQHRP